MLEWPQPTLGDPFTSSSSVGDGVNRSLTLSIFEKYSSDGYYVRETRLTLGKEGFFFPTTELAKEQ